MRRIKYLLLEEIFRAAGLFGNRRCVPKADVFMCAVRYERVAIEREGEKIYSDGICANGEDLRLCFGVPQPDNAFAAGGSKAFSVRCKSQRIDESRVSDQRVE